MTNELIEFKKRAHQHNICAPLAAQWDRCSTLQEVADTGLDIQGIEFLCRGAAEGWGIQPDFLAKEFAQYINGHYTHHSRNGYTSALYVNNEAEVTPCATNTALINCTCVVSIPETRICSLYISGDSEVVVCNEGYCAIHVYGNADVTFNGNGRTHIKRH